jgi:hypothetical protein
MQQAQAVNDFLDQPDEPNEGLFPVTTFIFGLAAAGSLIRFFYTTRKRFGFYDRIIGPATHAGLVARARQAFGTTPLLGIKEPSSVHSHGYSNTRRKEGKELIENVAMAMGYDVFQVQMSAGETFNQSRGTRNYFWTRDVTADLRNDEPKTTEVIAYIDVDYYMDMTQQLTTYPNNIHMLYTFTPEDVAGSHADYEFTFTSDNQVKLDVRGGASYSHLLYNYDVDVLTVTHNFTTAVYDVQKRRTSPNRSVVMLTPMRTLYGVPSILSRFMRSTSLRRVEVVTGTFTHLKVVTDEDRYTSIGQPGMFASARVPRKFLDEAKALRDASAGAKLKTYSVKKAFPDENIAALITNYVNSVCPPPKDVVNVRTISGMNVISYGNPGTDPKTLMAPFCKPFAIDPAYVHVKNEESERASIQKRVNEPAQKAKSKLLAPNEFMMRNRREFIKRLIPDPHTMTPSNFEEMYDRQSKPKQKSDLSAVGQLMYDIISFIKAFTKRESCQKVSAAPRNISTFPPEVKYRWASYVYPMMDLFKHLEFYAFSKTPKEVAENMARMAEKCEIITDADASKMDGSTNESTRHLEQMALTRAYHPDHVESALASHAESFGNKAITTEGLRYIQGFTRASGGVDTSLFNSLQNAEIVYDAIVRSQLAANRKVDYDDAWEQLLQKSRIGGDDGSVGDVPAELLHAAADRRGFTLTTTMHKRGEAGVSFLARIFGPHLWDGDPSSVCDFTRQLAKFHLATEVPDAPEVKLWEKGYSLFLSDSNTPIIGPLTRRIVELSKRTASEGTHSNMNFWAQFKAEDQWPNEAGAWMDEFCVDKLVVPDQVFLDWIIAADNINTLLNCPFEPEVEEMHLVELVQFIKIDEECLKAIEGYTDVTPTIASKPKRVKQDDGFTEVRRRRPGKPGRKAAN